MNLKEELMGFHQAEMLLYNPILQVFQDFGINLCQCIPKTHSVLLLSVCDCCISHKNSSKIKYSKKAVSRKTVNMYVCTQTLLLLNIPEGCGRNRQSDNLQECLSAKWIQIKHFSLAYVANFYDL